MSCVLQWFLANASRVFQGSAHVVTVLHSDRDCQWEGGMTRSLHNMCIYVYMIIWWSLWAFSSQAGIYKYHRRIQGGRFISSSDRIPMDSSDSKGFNGFPFSELRNLQICDNSWMIQSNMLSAGCNNLTTADARRSKFKLRPILNYRVAIG